MSAILRLQLFGAFSMEFGGKPASFARRKSESLLAYLVLHPGAQPRERIAAQFWSDSSDEDARRSLRVILADVRKTLGENVFIGQRDMIELNPEFNVEADTQKFTQLIHMPNADLPSALDLVRGELLEGMYDEWILPLRDKSRVEMLEARTQLVEKLRDKGEFPRAIEEAQKILAQDIYNEKALQHLLFCLSASGEREQVLQKFQSMQKSGMEFSSETIALYENIRKQSNSSAAAQLTNLPRALTSFIGREDELNAIETLLTETRLLTLLGAGGSGKTRLAIQAADEIAHQYPAGVWWVDLSALVEPELVAQSIAKTLGVKEQGDKNLLELSAALIGEARMLLVLDNCEHLISASAKSAEFLLTRCPALKCLATSREPLGISGEVGWQAPTFPLPEASSDLKTLKKNESIRLFVERARAVDVSFQLIEKNAAHVVEICRRLDGIPLAIELAAALTRSLSVPQVAGRLGRQFKALSVADESRIPRQKTLRALIDWSFHLLSPAEQMIFRRLGIFAGGWTLDMATIVAGGYDPAAAQENIHAGNLLAPLPIRPSDIVSGLLNALQRQSLIFVSYQDQTARYSMLETLREYALEQLTESAELNILRERHLYETLRFAEESKQHLRGMPDQMEWLQRLAVDIDNIRAALGWALSGGDIMLGMRLGSAMERFWMLRTNYSEARDWLSRLVAHPSAKQKTQARANALLHYALALRNTDELPQAISLADEAINILDELKDESGLAFACYCYGEVHYQLGEFEIALSSLVKGLEYYRAHPNESKFFHSSILATLARITLGFKDLELAHLYAQESLELTRAQGDVNGVGWSKLLLGDVAYRSDDLALAREYYEEALAIYSRLNRPGNAAYLTEMLCSLAFARSEFDAALNLVEESLTFYERGVGWSAFSRAYRGAVAQAQGDLQTAESWLLRCVTPLSDVELQYRAVYLVKLGDFALAKDEAQSAVTIYRAALQLDSEPVTVLFPPDRRFAQSGLAAAQKILDADSFRAAERRGESIGFEGAVRLIFPQVK